MINYRLKDSVVTHFPAIFKELGSKGSVIHMALDVELAECWRCEWLGADQLIVASVAAARSLIWQGSSSGGDTGWCWWRRRADLVTVFTANCARSG